MAWLQIILQVTIAFSIFNVWILRLGKPSKWRGGNAQTMQEEFEAYGLPRVFMNLIRFLKLAFATTLILGIYFPVLIIPSAAGIAILMLGAVIMHIKVKDPLIKSLPAFTFLVLSSILMFM